MPPGRIAGWGTWIHRRPGRLAASIDQRRGARGRAPGGPNPLAASSSTSTQSSTSPGSGGVNVRSPVVSNVPAAVAVPSRGLNHHAVACGPAIARQADRERPAGRRVDHRVAAVAVARGDEARSARRRGRWWRRDRATITESIGDPRQERPRLEQRAGVLHLRRARLVDRVGPRQQRVVDRPCARPATSARRSDGRRCGRRRR